MADILKLKVHNQWVGVQAIKGDPGNAGGFGAPTASADSNVGTPEVIVTASGPDTAKVFDFQFKNIKGATGEEGDPGSEVKFGTNSDIIVEQTTGTVVEANPATTTATLTGIKIGDTSYAVNGGGGTTVIANPTLVGTEADLTGLQVGETKYKVSVTDAALTSAKATGGIGWTENITDSNTTIIWDGDTTGKTELQDTNLYFVTSTVPASDSEFIGSVWTLVEEEDGAIVYTEDYNIAAENIYWPAGSTNMYMIAVGDLSEPEYIGCIITDENYPGYSKGIYLFCMSFSGGKGYVSKVVYGSSGSIIHKINSSYISSGTETSGKVLTADGNGGITWATGGGGGLPTPANAGDAMVYDGEQWTKQSGYGYHRDAGEIQHLTWDGVVGERPTVTIGEMTYVKVSETSIPDNELEGQTLTASMAGESMPLVLDTKEDHTNYRIYSSSAVGISLLLAVDNSCTVESQSLTPGMWFVSLNGAAFDLSYGKAELNVRIAQKYIYPDAIPGTHMLNIGTGWSPAFGTGGKATNVSGSSYTLDWDGTIEGKEIIELEENKSIVKLSDTVPNNITAFFGKDVKIQVSSSVEHSCKFKYSFESAAQQFIYLGKNLYAVQIDLSDYPPYENVKLFVYFAFDNASFTGTAISKGTWVDVPQEGGYPRFSSYIINDIDTALIDPDLLPITVWNGNYGTTVSALFIGNHKYDMQCINPNTDTYVSTPWLTSLRFNDVSLFKVSCSEPNPTLAGTEQQLSSIKINGTSYQVIPTTPTTDGAYVLKCTVVDGHQTYSWVSE